ncbi:MAG: HDIG domain-containing metalloprotein [Paludibacteraceae bacterium]
MQPLEIIKKYYTLDTPLYDTLVRHSTAVRDKALALAARHPELNIDTAFVAEAAMLHDIGIFKTNAPGIFCYGTHAYIEHGYLGAELLRQEHLPRHALVCERHTGTGLTLEQIISQQLPVPQRDMRPVSIEEQLICYADKFFSKTHLDIEIPTATARAKLAKFGEASVQQFDIWQCLFE